MLTKRNRLNFDIRSSHSLLAMALWRTCEGSVLEHSSTQTTRVLQVVTIEYIDHIMGELVTTNAWLAVDDDGHYIWTLDDNITVIDDDDVLDWRYM